MSGDAAMLKGSRVLVTGASRGYGAAVARALAVQGARLILTATESAHLERVGQDCRAAGAIVDVVVLDLSSVASVDAAAGSVAALVPRLEGVVMNAGIIGRRAPLGEADVDDVRHVLEVDLLNQVRLLQRIDPLIARDAAVVLVTSGAAGRAGWAGYALAKAGMEAAVRMLRDEWADRHVRVVAVNPGPIRTRMRAAAHPEEDPSTVPHPSARVGPVLAILAGEDPGPRIEASEWGLA